MVLQRLFQPRAARQSGAKLYEAVTRQARKPEFYVELGVPDSVEGRFELYSLHVVLLLHRLKGQGAQASEVSQALFDAYIRSLDDALRDLGVGDLSVGKKMRKLGEAFYGRVKSYESTLTDGDVILRDLVARTLYADNAEGAVDAMVAYIHASESSLGNQALSDIIEGLPAWAEIVS